MIKTKLLLVDDEESFVSALEKRLSIRELSIDKAYSGEEALQKLSSAPDVDVVLLDVKMPGMDGIATLEELRKRYSLIEVIMLTGHGSIETAVQGLKAGAFDYLLKPCEIDELISKVNEAKKKRQGQLDKILEATGRELRSRKGL
jgi:DNA-binding NtrC family response regulator